MNVTNIVTYGLFAGMGAVFLGIVGFALWTKLQPQAVWVLVDSNGERVGDATFLEAGTFRSGLAPVRTDAGWGYIDTDGNWVVMPQYSYAGEFDDAGYATASPQDSPLYGLTDTSGRWVVEPRYRSFGEVAQDGSVVVGERMGLNASSGTQRVRVGLYDLKTMSWLVQPEDGDAGWTNAAGPVAEDRLAVETSDGWRLVDGKGQPVVDAVWDRLWRSQSGRLRYQDGRSQGFVDLEGQVVVPARYGRCSDVVDGVASVRTGTESFLLDANGVQRGPAFTDLMSPAGGLVAAKDASGLWGFIDTQGAWVLQPEWSAVGEEGFASSVARVATDQGLQRVWRWIDADGQVVGEPAAGLTPFSEGRGFMRLQ